jgi:hypothetical protein
VILQQRRHSLLLPHPLYLARARSLTPRPRAPLFPSDAPPKILRRSEFPAGTCFPVSPPASWTSSHLQNVLCHPAGVDRRCPPQVFRAQRTCPELRPRSHAESACSSSSLTWTARSSPSWSTFARARVRARVPAAPSSSPALLHPS